MKFAKVLKFVAIVTMAVTLAACSTDESKTVEGQTLTDLGSVDIPGKTEVLHGYRLDHFYVYVIEKGPSRAIMGATQIYEVRNLGARKLPGQNFFVRGYLLHREGVMNGSHYVYFLEDAHGKFLGAAPGSYDFKQYIAQVSGVVSPEVVAETTAAQAK